MHWFPCLGEEDSVARFTRTCETESALSSDKTPVWTSSLSMTLRHRPSFSPGKRSKSPNGLSFPRAWPSTGLLFLLDHCLRPLDPDDYRHRPTLRLFTVRTSARYRSADHRTDQEMAHLRGGARQSRRSSFLNWMTTIRTSWLRTSCLSWTSEASTGPNSQGGARARRSIG